MISIEIVENSGRLMGMRAEWNELLEKSDSDCLFLTWEWLSMWWRHLAGDRRLFMPVVRDQGELVAIAPLVLRPPGISTILPLPTLEFMGTGSVGSDYLDVIIRRGHEERAMTAMAECLAEVNRAVELEQVKVHGCAAAGLGRILVGRGWGVWEEETNISRHIDLAGKSWPAYLAGVGAAHRYNFNRRLRQLGRQFEVRFEKTEREEERRHALGRLIALHRARWGNYSRAFHTPHHVRFHEEISRLAGERGWLRIFTLWLDGEAVAALYGFRYGRAFYFYQSGFDPIYARYSTGLVTMGLSIESAIEEGVEEYDMLQGLEQYKEPWAGGVRPLGRLELYPPHVRGLIYRRAMKLSLTAKRAARPHRKAAPSSALDMAASGRPAAVGCLSGRQGP